MQEKLINNFLRISKIPRKSGNEKQISNFFVKIAKENNLYYFQDNNYNLLIKKEGNIAGESIAFQAHLDMVCVKKEESNHNFDTDPIEVIIKDDKIYAKDTSLGADQGFGLSIMLTLIESKEIKHPNLEFIFTVEEETTFKGAETFPYEKIDSKIIINLDSDKDDALVINSAGDIVSELSYTGNLETRDMPSYKLTIDNIPGGNSGNNIDISANNAIIQLSRELLNNEIYISSINGGTFENDIATKCEAIIQTNIDLKRIITNKNIIIEQINNKKSFSLEESNRIIKEIIELKSGYLTNSASANLGEIKTIDNNIKIKYLIRSTKDNELETIQKKVKALNNKFKITILCKDPIWILNKESKLYQKYKETYYNLYKEYPKESTAQGGLEIATIQNHMNNIDIITIGANMDNIHTINEITYISSWEKIYNILISFLSN